MKIKPGMNILVLVDARNRLLKHDGDEFLREAKLFSEHWQALGANVTLHATYKKKMWVKKKFVLDAIKAHDPNMDVIAMFCHGWKSGVSLGFRNRDVFDLAEAIDDKGPRWKEVLLYACSTMKGQDSFGARLARELYRSESGAGYVYGHSTKGHCTRNPFVYSCKGREVWAWLSFIDLPWSQRRKNSNWWGWVEQLKTSDRFDFWYC